MCDCQALGNKIEEHQLALMGDDLGLFLGSSGVDLGHKVVQLETNSRDGLQLGVDQAFPITLQCA